MPIAVAAALITGADAPITGQPNPYTTIEKWGQLPEGRTWGSTSAVDVAPNGHIWVAERCGANTCAGSNVPPILEFDASGKLVKTLRRGHVRVPARHSRRQGRQRLGDRRAGQGRQGAPGLQVQPRRQGPADARQGRRRGRRTRHVQSAVRRRRRAERRHLRGRRPRCGTRTPASSSSRRTGSSSRPGASRARRPASSARRTASRSIPRAGCSSPIAATTASRSSTRTGSSSTSGSSSAGRAASTSTRTTSSTAPTPSRTPSAIPAGSAASGSAASEDGKVTAFIPDPDEKPDASATSGAEGVAADAQGNIFGAEVGPKMIKKYVRK